MRSRRTAQQRSRVRSAAKHECRHQASHEIQVAHHIASHRVNKLRRHLIAAPPTPTSTGAATTLNICSQNLSKFKKNLQKLARQTPTVWLGMQATSATALKGRYNEKTTEKINRKKKVTTYLRDTSPCSKGRRRARVGGRRRDSARARVRCSPRTTRRTCNSRRSCSACDVPIDVDARASSPRERNAVVHGN